jgi:hypothetical protein
LRHGAFSFLFEALDRCRATALSLSDIRQNPGGSEVRIAHLTGLGNGKSPSPLTKGARSRRSKAT